MNLLPDLSYFAVPGFVNQMRLRPVFSASLVLYDGSCDKWDVALSENDEDLYNWLHNRTADEHDVYLPHTVEPRFLKYHPEHIQKIIQPAKLRISSYLTELGVEDVDAYMADSDDWLNVLFSGKDEHYDAARLAGKDFGVEPTDFPAIIVWTNLDSPSVLKILPNKDSESISDYIKLLYSLLTDSARELSRGGKLTIDRLRSEFVTRISKSGQVKDSRQGVRSATITRLGGSLTDTFRQVGSLYARKFPTAILNFEERIKRDRPKEVLRYVSDTHKNMISKLSGAGFVKERDCGGHEIWKHPNLSKPVPLPRHKSISPGVVSSIERDIQQARQAAP